MPVFISPILAFLIAVALTWCLARYRGRWAILDHPNPRSSHRQPKPRSGGLAILAGLVAAAGWSAGHWIGAGVSAWAVAGVALIAAVSLVDDIHGLPAFARLPVHFAAAGAIVAGAGLALRHLTFPYWDVVLPGWIGIGGSILYLVWMLNLYNFMDGIDGLAGGMAVLGFGTYAVLGYGAGAELFATLSLSVAVASAGFLIFNFPPARIFMGDVGAGSLGLLAGVFTLWGARDGIFPAWVGVLVFSPFIVDATWTLVRRLLAREAPWRAHRSHAYQRLLRSGWSHQRTVSWEYILMTLCAISAIVVAGSKNIIVGSAIFFGWIACYIGLGFAVNRYARHRARGNK